MPSVLSPTIKKKIEKLAKNDAEKFFLLAILEKELTYVDKTEADYRDDFRDIIEKYFPFEDDDKN